MAVVAPVAAVAFSVLGAVCLLLTCGWVVLFGEVGGEMVSDFGRHAGLFEPMDARTKPTNAGECMCTRVV